jgi:hypothetical protein
MRTRNAGIGPWGLVLSILLVVSLTACGSSAANATPTLGVEAVFTMAFQTFTANEATQLALTPPTATASPTPAPTFPPPPTLSTFPTAIRTFAPGGSACDNGGYVADVTIPDNTVMSSGKSFDKTWTVGNTGSCAWNTSYKLVFVSGEQMGGAAASLPVSVPSGSQVNITVHLVAPATNGTYTGTWRMQNDKAVFFGGNVTVVIKVGGSSGPTATSGPTLTSAEKTGTASAAPTSSGTYTISGETGIPGGEVTIAWIGKGIDLSDVFSGGTYSITVPAHWDGTVSASRPGGNWDFSAPHTYSDVMSNKVNQNFTATPK